MYLIKNNILKFLYQEVIFIMYNSLKNMTHFLPLYKSNAKDTTIAYSATSHGLSQVKFPPSSTPDTKKHLETPSNYANLQVNLLPLIALTHYIQHPTPPF